LWEQNIVRAELEGTGTKGLQHLYERGVADCSGFGYGLLLLLVLHERKGFFESSLQVGSIFSLTKMTVLIRSSSWFYNLTTTAGFITWLCINLTYVFFHFGMKAQGFDLRSNAYNNRFQPYFAYWGIFWSVFFILTSGFKVRT
jgi:hypothetical protein